MQRLFITFGLILISQQVFPQEKDPQFEDPQNMKVKPSNTDCQELPESFTDLQQALTLIQSTRFYYDQKIKTTRKSGLMKARYVSCDFKTGFLLVQYDSRDEVYPKVKLELWEQFQQTADIDGYYFKHIQKLPTLFPE